MMIILSSRFSLFWECKILGMCNTHCVSASLSVLNVEKWFNGIQCLWWEYCWVLEVRRTFYSFFDVWDPNLTGLMIMLMFEGFDEKIRFYVKKTHFRDRQNKNAFLPNSYKIDGGIFDKNRFFYLHTSSKLTHQNCISSYCMYIWLHSEIGWCFLNISFENGKTTKIKQKITNYL